MLHQSNMKTDLSGVRDADDDDIGVRVVKDLSGRVLLLLGIRLHPDELLVRGEVELEAGRRLVHEILLIVRAARHGDSELSEKKGR